MDLQPIFILSFETYSLTTLLVRLDGPFNVFGRLRQLLGVATNELDGECTWRNEISHALCCRYCTAVYVAAILGVLQHLSFFAILASLGLLYAVWDWMH